MQKLSLLILLMFFASFTGASLHAVEFGFGDHEHHEVECQIDECLFQPISDAVSTPDILRVNNDSWIENTYSHEVFISNAKRDYSPRAPPFSV